MRNQNHVYKIFLFPDIIFFSSFVEVQKITVIPQTGSFLRRIFNDDLFNIYNSDKSSNSINDSRLSAINKVTSLLPFLKEKNFIFHPHTIHYPKIVKSFFLYKVFESRLATSDRKYVLISSRYLNLQRKQYR